MSKSQLRSQKSASTYSGGHAKCKVSESSYDPYGFHQENPILDEFGNIVYQAKFRKPKFVLSTELERFNRFENKRSSQDNSRNNRIRMEDPLSRNPGEKYIFPHIQDFEISKFIVSSSYLEKDKLDMETTIGM